MSAVLPIVVQTGLLIGMAPAVVGYLRWVKARLQNRRGATPLQPYRELRKLLGKEVVVADSASWVFHTAPFVVAGTAVAAAALVPVLMVAQPADAVGDLFALVALLMLGTVWLAWAGLDPGTAFGGMGASREMTVAALTEPTLATAFLTLALTTGSSSFGELTARLLASPGTALGPGHALAFVAVFIATLAEAGRLPFDNPGTHLELTMIHEAMVLEYAGPYLALVEWAAAVRLTLLLALAANVFVPWGLRSGTAPGALLVALGLFAVKLAILASAIAVLETRLAKLRLFRVPELLAASFVLALLGAASSVFTR